MSKGSKTRGEKGERHGCGEAREARGTGGTDAARHA